MTAGDIHVVHKDDNLWHVTVEGTDNSTSTHDTQTEAVRAGRMAARSAQSELLIHAEYGTIRGRRSYANPVERPGLCLAPNS